MYDIRGDELVNDLWLLSNFLQICQGWWTFFESRVNIFQLRLLYNCSRAQK